MKRAVETTEIVCGKRADIIRDERLRECDYGKLTGAASKLIDSISEKHIEKPFPKGESYKDVETRMRDFLKSLFENYSGKSAAVVAHRAPQLALDVILKGKTWEQAIKEDWRLKGTDGWRPGWGYSIKKT